MLTWLFWLMVGLAVVDWAAAYRGWKRVRWVSKPGTLIVLIAWFTQIGGWQNGLIWFGLGLIASLLGDIFLELPDRYFIPGVGAFALAHILYIIGFLQPPLYFTWAVILLAAVVGAVYWVLTSRIRAGLKVHHELKMQVPIMVYASVLSLMLLAALTILLRPDWAGAPAAITALGAGLFFVSDSVLAYSRFVRPISAGDLVVMVTYHTGQFLIAAGVLTRFAH